MKKVLLSASIAFMMFSCQKEDNSSTDQVDTTAHRGCASHEVLERQMQEDPGLASRMAAIEQQTSEVIKNNRLVNGVIEIPVIFNVLYNGTTENISLAQLQSQIDVLNADYAATNADYNTSNNPYSSVRSGNFNVRFVLDQVIRKSTKKRSWGTDDSMKKSTQGGISPTSPTTKLNIWVCNLGSSLLGYAQFPGGAAATDGVVLHYKYTGTTGTATAPFNLGRTATHEVGHWMNLRHIWGDANCGNDFVADTPLHDSSNYEVPAVGHRSTCTGTPLEMYMNYMDYTDDRGMYMFSQGQKERSLAIFAAGGARASFAQP
ncbi:zinc metalloprotease [Flavobacterium davisii]|uniref:Zinc metalloprotease n=1 Tax=Flavobacterium davisii TaxID=2906077 RepID=A0A246GMX6_9FLAO|nr:zinc metalloprotease [Flavobacterium davisii]OWP85101.1 zinc metalloprotease [Flavobacterium davisii]